MNKTIGMYGVGAFGYAILKHLDEKQSDDSLIAYDHASTILDSLKSKRAHPYFHPHSTVSGRPRFVDSPEELLAQTDIIVLAVSSDSTREVAQAVREHAKPGVIIVNIAKALDKQTGKRLSLVVSEVLDGFEYHYALLAGGTIADDLFRHEPLGVDVACQNRTIAEQLKDVFASGNLSVYPTDDLPGVEYAAALKNVISILAGIVAGLGFSYGSETHIISRTAHKVAKVCVDELGAQERTFRMGSQSWGNDMWMSCTGQTRNRHYGELIGKGTHPKEALEQMVADHKLVEGINTLQVIDAIPGLRDIPLISMLHNLVIDNSITVDAIRRQLLKN